MAHFYRPGLVIGTMLTVMAVVQPVPNASAQRLITLDQALEIAMENSPTIKHRKIQLERSRELLNAQHAALKSNFRMTLNPLSYSRDKAFNSSLSEWITTDTKSTDGMFTITQPIAKTDGTLSLTNRLSWQNSYSDYRNVRNEAFNNRLDLSLNQPLFTYNRTTLQTKQLVNDYESSSLNFALQKLSLEVQVSNAFFGVYNNKTNLDIAYEELKNQEASFEIIKNKVDAGLSALEELYQAELNLATTKSSVASREETLQNALDSFKVTLNIPLWEDITVDADIEVQPVEVDLDRALETALAKRIEIRQQEISLDSARDALITTAASNEFLGALSLSLGITGNDGAFGNLYDSPTQRQTVGLSFTIPLWDWGEKESRLRATELNIENQELTAEDERIAITLEIRSAVRSLNNLLYQIDIEKQNVRNAELTYEINLERYRNGDLTSMDLKLFQDQLSQRRMGLVRAQINYHLGLLDLKIKSLWDFEKNQAVMLEIE